MFPSILSPFKHSRLLSSVFRRSDPMAEFYGAAVSEWGAVCSGVADPAGQLIGHYGKSMANS